VAIFRAEDNMHIDLGKGLWHVGLVERPFRASIFFGFGPRAAAPFGRLTLGCHWVGLSGLQFWLKQWGELTGLRARGRLALGCHWVGLSGLQFWLEQWGE
jgi:hypothetical protein